MRTRLKGCSIATLVGLMTLTACGGSRNSTLSTPSSGSDVVTTGQQPSGSGPNTSGSSTGSTSGTSTGSTTGGPTNSTGVTTTNSTTLYLVYFVIDGMTVNQTLTVTLAYAGGTVSRPITFDPKVVEWYFGLDAPSNFAGLPKGTAYTLAISNIPTGLNCAISPASGIADSGIGSTISCTAGAGSASLASSRPMLAQALAHAAPALLRPAMAADTAGLTYLFGGMSSDPSGSQTDRSDLWISSAPGIWTKATISSGDIPAPRHAATAWLDSYGRLFIFGGLGAGTVFSDFWVFDPASDTWTLIPTKGASPAGRAGAAGWVGRTGDLYLYGSENDPSLASELWDFDIAAGSWREL